MLDRCPTCGAELTGTGILICQRCQNQTRDMPIDLRVADLERQLSRVTAEREAEHVRSQEILTDYAKRGEQLVAIRKRAEKAEAAIERWKHLHCKDCGRTIMVGAPLPCRDCWVSHAEVEQFKGPAKLLNCGESAAKIQAAVERLKQKFEADEASQKHTLPTKGEVR